MSGEGEFVELGGDVIRADRLAPTAAGIDDAAVGEAIDKVHDEPGWEPMPRAGWRILRDDGDSIVVGAYDDSVWHGWSTITLHRHEMAWRAAGATFGQHPRPTAASRGQGFSLAFSQAQFRCHHGEHPTVSVTLTKHTEGRFRDTTSWCAIGHLIDTRTGHALPAEESIAIATVGRDLDLSQGQCAEFPVLLTTRNLEALEPGEYGIQASFSHLDLKARNGRLIVV